MTPTGTFAALLCADVKICFPSYLEVDQPSDLGKATLTFLIDATLRMEKLSARRAPLRNDDSGVDNNDSGCVDGILVPAL